MIRETFFCWMSKFETECQRNSKNMYDFMNMESPSWDSLKQDIQHLWYFCAKKDTKWFAVIFWLQLSKVLEIGTYCGRGPEISWGSLPGRDSLTMGEATHPCVLQWQYLECKWSLWMLQESQSCSETTLLWKTEGTWRTFRQTSPAASANLNYILLVAQKAFRIQTFFFHIVANERNCTRCDPCIQLRNTGVKNLWVILRKKPQHDAAVLAANFVWLWLVVRQKVSVLLYGFGNLQH